MGQAFLSFRCEKKLSFDCTVGADLAFLRLNHLTRTNNKVQLILQEWRRTANWHNLIFCGSWFWYFFLLRACYCFINKTICETAISVWSNNLYKRICNTKKMSFNWQTLWEIRSDGKKNVFPTVDVSIFIKSSLRHYKWTLYKINIKHIHHNWWSKCPNTSITLKMCN